MKREKDESKLKKLQEDLANLEEKSAMLCGPSGKTSARSCAWRTTGQGQEIESVETGGKTRAEREGDFSQVAEIRYGRIPEVEEQLARLTIGSVQEMQATGKQLVKEEVEAEDIAEIVAKWTGIPVTRMLQSEREKLLHLEDELHKRVIGQDEAVEAVSDAIRLKPDGAG